MRYRPTLASKIEAAKARVIFNHVLEAEKMQRELNAMLSEAHVATEHSGEVYNMMDEAKRVCDHMEALREDRERMWAAL